MDWGVFAKLGSILFDDGFWHLLAVIAVWGFFISGIDDLFIDFRYLWFVISKRGTPERIRMVEADKLVEKPVAVMVPAWQEANVIRSMLMRNVTNIDYSNYHFFVGTYPNDKDTMAEVEGVIRHFRRLRLKSRSADVMGVDKTHPGDFIHMVVTPRPGPTNKADNLNSVYRRIRQVEQDLIDRGELDSPFEIYVLHDCEDVIHPKELKLFNYLMTNLPVNQRPSGELYREQYDFVQLPVFPLEVPIKPAPEYSGRLAVAAAPFKKLNPLGWLRAVLPTIWALLRYLWAVLGNMKSYAVSATYMDEFAEHHTKDMLVRRDIGGLVPSAGVGTGFNRKSLEKLAEENPKGIFNDVHLTEDYEISLHLKNQGAKQFFMVEPVKMLKYVSGHLDETHEVDEFVATKEYFPDTVKASVKQKARWIMGITYQTIFPGRSSNPFVDFMHGWKGSLRTKYTLLRDRKALVTNYINILGYLVFFYCLVRLFMDLVYDIPWTFSAIFPPASYLWWMLLFTTILLVERFLQRFHAVRKIYGFRQSMYFLLRALFLVGLFLGNIIGFLATLNATFRYFTYIMRRLFSLDDPDEDDERDIQTEKDGQTATVSTANGKVQPAWGKTDHSYLSEEQMREYVNRIGNIAVRSRLLKPIQLEEALQRQRSEQKKLGEVLKGMGIVDDAGFSMLYAQQLSLPTYEIDPLEIDQKLLDMVSEDVAIEYRFMPISIDDAGNLIIAVSDPLEADEQQHLEELLGRRLKTVITYDDDLDFSRRRAYGHFVQRATAPIQKLGVYLLQKDVINEDQLSDALYLQKVQRRPLGEVLLDQGSIAEEQLDAYFRETLGIGFRRLTGKQVETEAISNFPRAFCQINRAIPFSVDSESITFAISNFSLRETMASLEEKIGKRVECILSPEADIQQSIEDGYSRFNEEEIRRRLLGTKLIESGVINEAHLEEALRQQRGKGMRLGEVLISYGYCDEKSFLEIYSDQLLLPVVDPSSLSVGPSLAGLFARASATSRNIVPLGRDGNSVSFALPYDFTEDDISSIEGRFPSGRIKYVLALKTDIRRTIRRIYDTVGSDRPTQTIVTDPQKV